MLPGSPLKSCASNPPTSYLLQDAPKSILDAINCIHYPSLMYALLLVNWLPTFRNKHAHIYPWIEIFLNISTLEYETTRLP